MKSKLPAPVSDRSTMTNWNELRLGPGLVGKYPTLIKFTPKALRPLTVSLPYLTTLPVRVSTSAKNGAIMGVVEPVIANGVKVASAPVNVTLPLLLTKSVDWTPPLRPKKLMLKPMATGPTD